MQKNKLTSILVLMMSVIILIGAFCLPASAATSISKATVTYTSAQTYTGKAITPAVTVKVGKTTLKKGTHYTVAYKNNKAVGKATITVTGKGSYSGKVTKYFYISPKAVTNLKATPYAKQIKLTWTKATGATAYQIQQKIGGTWTKIATVSGSSTSYTVTGLNGATKYEFRIRGYAKSGSKALYSAFKSVSATTTIGKATGIKASDIADSTATLKWDKVSGANSYRIALTNVATNYKKNYTSTTNSLKLTGLTSLTEYKVTITASNTSKNITGAASAAYKFSTAPASVTNLQAIVDEYGAVSLTWNKVAGADGYKVIYNKLDASGNVTATKDSGVITKNSCGIKNLTPLSYYVFKVVSAVKTDSGSYIYSKEVSTAKIGYDYTEMRDKANDFEYLKEKAEEGYFMAMYRLGRYYLENTTEMIDAEYWLEQATEGENTAAMYQIYKAYRDGKFTTTPSHKMKYLRMAVDYNCHYAEYEYSKILKESDSKLSRVYLERAANHGNPQAQYDLGKILAEEGRQEEAFEYFEAAAKQDLWAKTSLGLMYCSRYDEWDLGMEHLNEAAERGYEPAFEAVNAIHRNLNAQIVFGVCDLLYYASNIIDDRTEDMYTQDRLPVIDKKQRREIRAKKQGLTMGGM